VSPTRDLAKGQRASQELNIESSSKGGTTRLGVSGESWLAMVRIVEESETAVQRISGEGEDDFLRWR
jgi:hypothetical protein